ncbi:MAG TPA: ATP-binding protein [Rhodanobacteraceae bacterium]|nr:ATP-binding protein [Rhodanobacteraceae bacterium]
MESRKPLSLAARSTLAGAIALLVFLGATGFALDHAYAEGSLAALRDRMESYVLAYMARFDVSRYGKLIPPDAPPDPDFSRPGSGLYASVTAPKEQWDSPSAIGRGLPLAEQLKPAETRFSGPIDSGVGRLYVLAEGVAWVMPDGKELPLTFHVAQDESTYQAQLQAFRRTLVYWLAGIGVALLLVQLLLLRWTLSPLRRMAGDMAGIERGEREQLAGNYPEEVDGLAHSLNSYIDSERERIKRYRNILGDLAHSLKTPLAVMRSRLEAEHAGLAAYDDMMEQVRRMDEIVAYQLSRAATTGHPTFAVPIEIEPAAEDLVRSLEKVYQSKNILCEFEIEADSRFYGERGDLLELLGNLLENAFKWAAHRVVLRVKPLKGGARRRPGLELAVEDDGPGIPADRVEHVLQRGVRGDERVSGHGIGLAIVQDIVRAYRADLEVGPSRDLGGASFVVRLLPD